MGDNKSNYIASAPFRKVAK